MELRHVFSGHCRTTEKDAIDFYGSRAFLVLDDLGAEKASEFTVASLSVILDRRIREGLPTVVTTNLTLGEIGDAFGERISSRLCEFCLISLSAPDFRKGRR
jgi:DNA replication protein DnaC